MRRFLMALLFVFMMAGTPLLIDSLAFLVGGPVAGIIISIMLFLITMASLLAFDIDKIWERMSRSADHKG